MSDRYVIQQWKGAKEQLAAEVCLAIPVRAPEIHPAPDTPASAPEPCPQVKLIQELEGVAAAFGLPPGSGMPTQPAIIQAPSGPAAPPPAYNGAGAPAKNDVPVSVVTPGQRQQPKAKQEKEDPEVWDAPSPPPERKDPRGRGGHDNGGKLPQWANRQSDRATNLQKEANDRGGGGRRKSAKPAGVESVCV